MSALPKLRVSHHAMVRYCERVLGLTREDLAKSMAVALGEITDGRHKLPDLDVVAVVKEGTVVTFVPMSKPLRPVKKKKRKKSQARVTVTDEPWMVIP